MIILERKYRCGFVGVNSTTWLDMLSNREHPPRSIANFESNTFQRKSKKGKVHLVRKKRQKNNLKKIALGAGLVAITVPSVIGLGLMASRGSLKGKKLQESIINNRKEINNQWQKINQNAASNLEKLQEINQSIDRSRKTRNARNNALYNVAKKVIKR